MNTANIIYLENWDKFDFDKTVDLNNYIKIDAGIFHDGDIIYDISRDEYKWAVNCVGEDIKSEFERCYRPRKKINYIEMCYKARPKVKVKTDIRYNHPVLWEPTKGDCYFYCHDGVISWNTWYNDAGDQLRKQFGNCWKTYELAEKFACLGVVTPYLREIAKYNSNEDGSYWWPDWERTQDVKFLGRWNMVVNEIDWKPWSFNRICNDLFYFKDVDFKPSKVAIESFKKHLGI